MSILMISSNWLLAFIITVLCVVVPACDRPSMQSPDECILAALPRGYALMEEIAAAARRETTCRGKAAAMKTVLDEQAGFLEHTMALVAYWTLPDEDQKAWAPQHRKMGDDIDTAFRECRNHPAVRAQFDRIGDKRVEVRERR